MPVRKPQPHEFHNELKKQLPINQRELAERFDVTQARISQIMRNASDPPLWMLIRLKLEFNVDVFDLYFAHYRPKIHDRRISKVLIQGQGVFKMFPDEWFNSDDAAERVRVALTKPTES